MRYLLCVLCPPLAILTTGRFFSAFISIFLTLLFWVPGMIHAFFVVSDYKNEKRFKTLRTATPAAG